MKINAGMIIGGLFGTFSARIFTAVIGFVFLFSLLVLIFRPSSRAWIISKAPGILTALGLFGTFWGIAEGLGGFDPYNIDASIPVLLDGMKLAFWTSILGMFCAIVLNAVYYAAGIFSDDEDIDTQETIEEALNSINTMNMKITELTNCINILSGKIVKSSGAHEEPVNIQTLQNRIDELTENIASSITNSAQAMEKATQAMEKAADEQAKHITSITLNLENVLKHGASSVESTFAKTGAAIENITAQTINRLDHEMEKVLRDALQIMADNLASIDEKMINDIQTLTKRLEELSREASGKHEQLTIQYGKQEH